MIDELMNVAGPESLSDLSHLDSSLSKASHVIIRLGFKFLSA